MNRLLPLTILEVGMAVCFCGFAWHGWRRGEAWIVGSNMHVAHRDESPVLFWCNWLLTAAAGVGFSIAAAWSIRGQIMSGVMPPAWAAGIAIAVLALAYLVHRVSGDPNSVEHRRDAAFRAVLRELGNDTAANMEGPALDALMQSPDVDLLEAVAAQLAAQRPPRRLDVAIAAARGERTGDA